MKKLRKITATLSLTLCLIMLTNINASAAVTSKKGWYAASYGTTYTLTGKDATKMYDVILNGSYDKFTKTFNALSYVVPILKTNPLYWSYKLDFTITKLSAKHQRKITPNKLKLHFGTLPVSSMQLVPIKK